MQRPLPLKRQATSGPLKKGGGAEKKKNPKSRRLTAMKL